MSEYLSVREAQTRILEIFQPTGHEFVPLVSSAGRVLAKDITAPEDMPLFDYSSMDGFAIHSSDVQEATPQTPVTLKITADIPAGSRNIAPLYPGHAARIMTGAMIPTGADVVIPVEDTNFAQGFSGDQAIDPKAGTVTFSHSTQAGAYIRLRGEDVIKGQKLLTRGRRLQAQDVAILAATGHASVPVYQKPPVALFSSGDELVIPGEPLQPGQIYDSNQYLLTAMLESEGASVLRLRNAPDDPREIQNRLDQAVAQGASLIVASAGVSAGEFDYVRQVIENNGKLDFWKVNMRPGKPLAFGFYANTPVIGLPGNPVSAFVGCRLFVLPAITRLSGCTQSTSRIGKAFLGETVESDGRESYLRAIVQEENGRLVARLTGHQGSGNLFSLVQANALLIVPSGVKSLPLDSEANVLLIS